MLFLAGIGLVRHKRWGVQLAFTYCCLHLAVLAAKTILQVAIHPWFLSGFYAESAGSSLRWHCLRGIIGWSIWPIVLLWWLSRGAVRQAMVKWEGRLSISHRPVLFVACGAAAWPVVTLLLVLLFGPIHKPSTGDTLNSFSPLATRTVKALPEAAYRRWAAEIETSTNAGDPTLLRRSMNFRMLAEEALSSLPDKGDTKRFAIASFAKGMEARDLAEGLCSTVAACGKMKLLGLRSVGGQSRALFRVSGNGGFDYWDFILAATEDGNVRVCDCYTYTSCDTLGDGFRRMYLLGVELGSTGRTISHDALEAAKVMQRHVDVGEFPEALAAMEKIPEPFRNEKWVVLKKVEISASISPAAYMKAVDEFRGRFPDCSGVDITSISRCIAERQFGRAKAAVDRLEHSVTDDTYCEVLRGHICILEGHLPQAREYLTKAIQAEGDLPDAYRALAGLAIQEGDFKEAVRCLTIIENTLKRRLPDLQEFSRYSDFARSPEYRSWRASH